MYTFRFPTSPTIPLVFHDEFFDKSLCFRWELSLHDLARCDQKRCVKILCDRMNVRRVMLLVAQVHDNDDSVKITDCRHKISPFIFLLMSLDSAAPKSGTKNHPLCGCASIVILLKMILQSVTKRCIRFYCKHDRRIIIKINSVQDNVSLGPAIHI